MKFIRSEGERRGDDAELHVFSDGSSKVVFTVPSDLAQAIAEHAVLSTGEAAVEICFQGRSFSAKAVEARIVSIDPSGQRRGPGIVGFKSLQIKP